MIKKIIEWTAIAIFLVNAAVLGLWLISEKWIFIPNQYVLVTNGKVYVDMLYFMTEFMCFLSNVILSCALIFLLGKKRCQEPFLGRMMRSS
jgi:hypothetical protein